MIYLLRSWEPKLHWIRVLDDYVVELSGMALISWEVD
jgi:hypothetical protein